MKYLTIRVPKEPYPTILRSLFNIFNVRQLAETTNLWNLETWSEPSLIDVVPVVSTRLVSSEGYEKVFGQLIRVTPA